MASRVLALLVNIITARLLAPELFGLIALVATIVTVAQIFADAGSRAAVVYFPEPIKDVVATAMLVLPLASVLGAGAMVVAAPLVADFYGDPRLELLTIGMAGLLPIHALTVVPDALLQRRLDLKLRRGLVDPLTVALNGVVATALALAGAEEWSLVGGTYAWAAGNMVGAWVLAKPLRDIGRPSVATWRRIGNYGRHILIANLLEVAEGQGPVLVLGRNLNATAVGLYSLGSRLAVLPIVGLARVAGQVVFPALARVRDDVERLRANVLEAFRLLSMLSIPACVTLLVLAEPLVVVAFGERWRAAGEVLAVLAIWAAILWIAELGREVFKAVGRPKLVSWNGAVETTTVLGTLALLWVFDAVSLLAVAGAQVVAAVAVSTTTIISFRAAGVASPLDLARAVRTPLIAGAIQLVALDLILRAPLSGLDGWREVAGIEFGVVLPALLLLVLIGVGGVVYLGGLELAERGSGRRLVRRLREIASASG